jgi:hypothetical protein
MERCVHCSRAGHTVARGLCKKCYGIPAIRVATPVRKRGGYTRNSYHEPTEAELDALIAAQLPTMPKGHDAEDDPPALAERRRIGRSRSKKTPSK